MAHTIHLILLPLLSIRRQIAEPGQVFDDRSRISVLALVQLGELECQKLRQTGFELSAQRVLTETRLQALVGLKVLLDLGDSVYVRDEGYDVSDVLFETIGSVCLNAVVWIVEVILVLNSSRLVDVASGVQDSELEK